MSYEKSHKIKRPRMEPNQPITTQTTDPNSETPTPQKQQKIWLPIHPTVLQRLSYFIQTHKIPHLLFHGNSGTGKRTIVNQFIREIYHNSQKQMESNVMYVNCAHEKGIQFIRGEIKTFARINVQQYNPQPLLPNQTPQKSQQHQQHEMFKIIVLHNSDKLTIDAQSALRRSIEIYSHNTRFFIIVENIQKIMNPILSRFCEIYIPDRMDTEGNVIPLHHFYQYFTQSESQQPKNQQELAKIPALIINPTTTPQQWMELCSTFYEKGISGYELVQFAPHFLLPSLKAELDIEFQKVKSEFRCEKLLMFYLIYFLVSRLHSLLPIR
jgi:hypothetical protein